MKNRWVKVQQWAISEMPVVCVSKRGLVRNLFYEHEFDLHENEHENEHASKTNFHNKGFPLGLVLKQGKTTSRK